MKILIQQVFAHQKPTYLIPNYIKSYTNRSFFLDRAINSVGIVKSQFFQSGIFDGIEFDAANLNILDGQNWELKLKRVRRLQEQGLNIESVHGVFPHGESPHLDKPEQYLNLGFLSGGVVNGIKTHVRLTAAIVSDNPILVLHPGIVPDTMHISEAIDNVSNNLKLCLTDLEKTKVTICIENLAPPVKKGQWKIVGQDFNVVKEIVSRVNHPQVKIVYDWGHANASARIYYEKNRENLPSDYLSSFTYHKELVNTFGIDLVYMHLNYNLAHWINFKEPRGYSMTGWDFHQGINTADPQSLAHYKDILMEIYFNSGLRSHGTKALLELSPKGIMRYLGLGYVGATDNDAIESVRLLKQWFTEFEEIGKNMGAKKQ